MATLAARLALKQAASVARRTSLRNRQVAEFRRVFEELLGLELPEIRDVVRRSREAEDWQILQDWIEEFYPGQQERAAEALRPAMLSYGGEIVEIAADEVGGDPAEVDVEGFTDAYLESFRERWGRDSIAPVRAAVRDLEGDELDERLAAEFDDWEESRAGWNAEREATQAAGAYATAAYAASGVEEIVWRANAGACELCEQMDGRIVSITAPFLGAGESVSAGGEQLVTQQRIGHPPLHGNRGRGGVCQCQIAAS